MANKTEKNAATENAKVEVTTENVVEQLKAGNKFEEDVTNEAINQLKKEKKDRQVNELKRAINRASYDEKKCLISLRKGRAVEKLSKERLKNLDVCIDELKNGKLTPVEYEKKTDAVKEEHRKKMAELDKEYEEYYRELRNAFPSFWGWDWE